MTASGGPPRRVSPTIVCSICGRSFRLDQTTAPPFCSDRCKTIDLGRWLDEQVSVPHEGGPTKGEVIDHDAHEPDDEEAE